MVVEHSGSEGITVLRFLEEFLLTTANTTNDACHAQGATSKDIGNNKSAATPAKSAGELLAANKIVCLQWHLDDVGLRAVQEAGKRVDR